MAIVFISGAYRNDDILVKTDNIARALQYAKKYLLMGHSVLCPHSNTGMDFGDMENDIDFCKMYLNFIPIVDIVVMIPGWELSNGSLAEHEEALRLNKQIIYERDE